MAQQIGYIIEGYARSNERARKGVTQGMRRHIFQPRQVSILHDHIIDSMSRKRLTSLAQQQSVFLAGRTHTEIRPKSSSYISIEWHAACLIALAAPDLKVTRTFTKRQIMDTQSSQLSCTQ